jgi:hypothetical protein
MRLELVETEKQKTLTKDLICNNHSYVPTYKSVGRKIDWLIYDNDELMGMIGIGSSTYPPCKDILRHLNITKDDYRKMFNNFGNNWRFCFSNKKKNLGTQTLKAFRKDAPIQWKLKYGDTLKYIITFVGAGKTGAVYRADNWELIGKTAGLPKHKSSSMKWHDNAELKKLFVKPTGENKKLIFIKHLKKN